MFDVSVIVPVYNTSRYLRRSLDALCKQTLENIEIILVNDGSTDDSPAIMQEYQDKYKDKIRICNKANGGQATARNLGIREATGKYIGFADSDDYIDRDMFKKMYEKAVEEDADYVECHYHCLYEDGDNIREIPERGDIRAHADRKDMFINPQVSPWNKLYRREILQENDITFPEGVIYEDTSFYIKSIPFIEKSSYLEEKLVYYCVRNNSTMTANKNIKVADIFKVLDDMLIFFDRHNLTEEYREELEFFYAKIILCSSLGRIGRIGDKKLRKELVKKSFRLLRERFPNYRNNRYFDGKIALYIKNINELAAGFAAPVLGRVMKG